MNKRGDLMAIGYYSTIYSRCAEVVNGIVRQLQNAVQNGEASRLIIEWAMLAGQELFKVRVEL